MDISTKNSGYESLFDRCSSLCSELVKQGCKFSFSLKLEESFSFTLSSEKAVPRGTRKRPPSYQRRQHRRKTELLQRRTEFRRTNEAAEDIDNDGRRQEGADLLDKKMVSSRQTATEDNNTPLNLNPRAIYPRGSVESVEQEEDNCVNRDENNVDNKSPQSKPPAANNQESSEDEEEDEESEEMEDSDKEGDRCGTDARSRQKEREADSVPAAWQKCSCSVHKGVCLACIHQRFLKWKKSSEKGPT